MAYYSFYKIIKDIILTIFGNKFLKYLFIFIIVFLIYTIFLKGTSYGAVYDFTIGTVPMSVDTDTNTYTFKNQYVLNSTVSSKDYMLITYAQNSTSEFRISVSDEPMYFTETNGNILVQTTDTNGIYYRNFYNSSTTAFSSNSLSNYTQNSSPFYSANCLPTRIAFANYDVYNNDTKIHSADISYFINPFISTPATAFQNLTFSHLFIEAGSLTSSDTFYLHRLEITDTVTDGSTTYYYYSDKTFPLDINSKYYKQFLDTTGFYYSIPKYEFNFGIDKQYLFVLDNSSEQYNNSVGLIDTSFNGVYHVYNLDTTGFYSSADITNDNLDEINENLEETKTFEDTLLSDEYNEDLPNDTLNSIGGGFRDSVDDTQYIGLFSTIFQKLGIIFNGNYDSLEEIKIYLPHSGDKYISLRSDLVKNFLYNSQSPALYDLVQIFWLYLFGVYVFSFSYSIIRAIKTGSLLGGYSWENEAITNTML